MAAVGAISIPLLIPSSPITTKRSNLIFNLRVFFNVNSLKQSSQLHGRLNHISPRAAASSSTSVSVEEPVTKVKFQTSVSLPGCSSSLSLLGTGYREKVFVIIGVKVYAAGFYVDRSVFSNLQAWKGRSPTELQQDKGLFDTLLKAQSEKSLQIVLVRDIDGKTFWDALDEAISPRISSPTPADESALFTFRTFFQDRALKTGTIIFLTWVNPAKILVSVSSDGIPSSVDTTIESLNVTSAFFDVFFGDATVSPSLKTSVAEGLSTALKV